MSLRPFGLFSAFLVIGCGDAALAEGLRHPFCGTYPGIEATQIANVIEARARRMSRSLASNTRAASAIITAVREAIAGAALALTVDVLVHHRKRDIAVNP